MKITFKTALLASTVALGLGVAGCAEEAAEETTTEETMAEDTMAEDTMAEDTMGEDAMADETMLAHSGEWSWSSSTPMIIQMDDQKAMKSTISRMSSGEMSTTICVMVCVSVPRRSMPLKK